MKLCVGAVSSLVVQEAAALGMTVVASRRQVDIGGGYTGWDAAEFARVVHAWPNARAVRDHGGPLQGGYSDDGTESLNADVAAGFDALHIDVCCVHNDNAMLHSLVKQYAPQVALEIGDEHAPQSVNDHLLATALNACGRGGILVGVISTGSYVWADSQVGTPLLSDDMGLVAAVERYHTMGVMTKAHNMDWVEDRHVYDNIFDEYNLAPEIGAVEIDAILSVSTNSVCNAALAMGHASMKWRRWFDEAKNEGTWVARAKCGLRYIRNSGVFPPFSPDQEVYVREVVRDALIEG